MKCGSSGSCGAKARQSLIKSLHLIYSQTSYSFLTRLAWPRMVYRDTNLSPGSVAAPVRFQLSIVGFLYRSRQAGARNWTDSLLTGTKRPFLTVGGLFVANNVSLVAVWNFIFLHPRFRRDKLWDGQSKNISPTVQAFSYFQLQG